MIAERPTTVPAGAETLEARLAVPAGARLGVVVSHPHPLYGGDMDSPVVARIVESCAGRGLATLRFNFRGVGASTGRHDEGRGEQDDVRASLARLQEALVLLELKQPAVAEQRLQYLVETFPQSEESALARERLAALRPR